MPKPTDRAKIFRQFDEHIEKDYDPETPDVPNETDSEGSGEENAGTEHYVSVDKSKLRKKGGDALGPQYRGAKVSRKALEQDSEGEDEDEDEDDDGEEDEEEEFDDPEQANIEADTAQASDSEISSDNALGDSDDDRFDKFVFRGSSNPKQPKGKQSRAKASDFISASEDDDAELSGADLEDSEDDEDMDDGLEALINGEGMDDDSDEDDDEDEDEDEDEEGQDEDEDEEEDDEDSQEDSGDEQATTLKAAPTATPLSTRDVDKGVAIQQQRKAYDALLNIRIRLQKALIAANTFPTLEDESDANTQPYEAAEEAAIKLLNTISGLRENLAPTTVTGKRKRDFDLSTPSQQIWKQLQDDEESAVKFRESCIEKWSRKVQSVNVAATRSLGVKNKTIVNALREQLDTPENRLIKRTRVPRSCAPAQAAKKITDDEEIYDDADFYQQLLKELVDQRTVDGASSGPSAVPSVVLTATRESKARKVVDRKASKGRKMRFTVHEKLQNFMAPEDRRSWEQAAIDRFFGTLFGRKLELNEDESEDEGMEGTDVAGTEFRLFGN